METNMDMIITFLMGLSMGLYVAERQRELTKTNKGIIENRKQDIEFYKSLLADLKKDKHSEDGN
jgi:hypothetical protein